MSALMSAYTRGRWCRTIPFVVGFKSAKRLAILYHEAEPHTAKEQKKENRTGGYRDVGRALARRPAFSH